MSSEPSIHTDVVEAILEHAESIGRIGGDTADDREARARHVEALRLLALPHVDPQPDRGFMRELRTRSGGVDGVYVRLVDGAVQLVIDSAAGLQRVKLWTRRQLLENEEDDDGDD